MVDQRGPVNMCAPEIVERVVDASLLVYDLDQQRVHVLNQTAALVWTLCDGTHSTVEIAALVKSHFPGHQSDVECDVTELVHSFAAENLVSI